MIDSANRGGEEGEAKEQHIISDHEEGRSKAVNNYGADDLIDNTDGHMSDEGYVKFYEQYLYSLLPAIYQDYDSRKENNVLYEFLKIIASQVAAIRKDIDGLLNNFFINSSEEWAIPYIADLIAAKIVPNSSLNSRLDVQNTMRWRKLKGTQAGLVELLRNTINRNARVKEAFRYCSSTSHLVYKSSDIAVNKPQVFVNLHDENALSNIDSENDSIPHTIDIREPTQTNGWYNIKNFLLFMPQLNTYHINQVQAKGDEDGLRYYFSNLVQKQQQSASNHSNHFPLYDLDEGVKIRGTAFTQDPFKYFGKKRGMSVKIDNILAACPSAPTFSPAVEQADKAPENRVTITTASGEPSRGSNSDYSESHKPNNNIDNINTNDSPDYLNPDFISLHKTEGIRILEPRKFGRDEKPFILRLYCYSEKHGSIEIAQYNTSKMSYRILPRSKLKKVARGTILISIEVDSKMLIAAEFPESVIAIRDSRAKILVENSLLSKYRNALYVYLPSILVNHIEKKYFVVDRNGSTFEVQMNNDRYDMGNSQLGLARTNKNLRTRIAPSSQVYPSRELIYSMRSLNNFAELNRFTGIKAVDAKRYGKGSYEIEAIALNSEKRQAWKIGKLEINGSGSGGSLSYFNEKEFWILWRISLDGRHYHDNSYKEQYLPACHFKATRLDLENNLAEYSINIEEIVKSILPEAIVPEGSQEEKIGKYRIDPYPNVGADNDDYNNNNNKKKTSMDNTYEYEVKIIVKHEHSEHFEYLANEIKNNIDEKQEFVNEGKLMLRILKKTTASRDDFPLSEIILANSFGSSVLVYLPELKFDKNNTKYDLYVADDGSTSYEKDLLNPARKSAGQIIPIANKYPLQHRIPVYVNLADWKSVDTNTTVHSGELAIDPEHGRFAFSKQDDAIIREGIEGDNKTTANAAQSMHATVDYNYAFSHDIGAGAYDRRASLKKATKWVSKNRHASHKNAFPSKTYQSIAEALASAEDDDVIQIEDSGIYDEGDKISNTELPPGVRFVTLQAANLTMPIIKVNDVLKLDSGNSLKHVTLNGIAIIGGPLAFSENFEKIALISCTVSPAYYKDNDDKSTLGIKVEQKENQMASQEDLEYDNDTIAAAAITNTTSPNIGNGYDTRKSDIARLKEICLISSISGGILVGDSVSLVNLADSIVHNPGGPSIFINKNNKNEKIPILRLEATRSTILSKYADDHTLELKGICCNDCILTGKINVKLNEKQQEDQTGNDDTTSCNSSLRYSRYEQGSTFDNIGTGNNSVIVDCTMDRPIFISTTFGDPAYLHLDRLSSKSILEGAQNTLEMGAFNKSYKPLRIRNLNLRLQEFLPLGIKSGVIYTY